MLYTTLLDNRGLIIYITGLGIARFWLIGFLIFPHF